MESLGRSLVRARPASSRRLFQKYRGSRAFWVRFAARLGRFGVRPGRPDPPRTAWTSIFEAETEVFSRFFVSRVRARATSCEVNKTSKKMVRNTHRRSRATNKKREKIVLRAVRTARCAVRALGWRAGVFQERLWSCSRAFLGDLGAQLGSSRPPLGQPELVLGRPMAVPGAFR